MSQPVIEVQNLHKDFMLGHATGSIKSAILWWRKRRLEGLKVLRGVSFEVMPGEAVAVVGRNGAGKSTLLSLIARVYKPTSGKVIVRGRLAPLLELGAGFHPDLTGRENVFFNGIILGLTRKQMRERLDEIVAFAEVEDHIDVPVRNYSSGMLARLGFSVAVHVDADMLIVDEVLAVGDFAFEQKCFDRLEQFRAGGGAILMVSHEAQDIRRMADRCIWLKAGQIEAIGTPDEIMDRYEADGYSEL